MQFRLQLLAPVASPAGMRRVTSWPDGRLAVRANPRDPLVHYQWEYGPVKMSREVHLPRLVDPHSATAVLSLHGQLYIKIGDAKT